VVIGASSPLASGLAAHQLPRLIFRRLEILLTVAASPIDHTGGCRIPGARPSGQDSETPIECSTASNEGIQAPFTCVYDFGDDWVHGNSGSERPLCLEFLCLFPSRTESIQLPPRSPNLNAFAERWVGPVKQECLSN
jgi:hypothetical protein